MNTSREHIIANIRKNKPRSIDLPEIPLFNQDRLDLIGRFEFAVVQTGGHIFHGNLSDLSNEIEERFQSVEKILVGPSLSTDVSNSSFNEAMLPHELDDLDLMIVRSDIGVAENGAVWVDDNHLGHRAQPFITKHLLIIIEKENIVCNMHEAYDRVRLKEIGYGVFIAGPSKTADIEKTLVIGAQGALSYHVMLI